MGQGIQAGQLRHRVTVRLPQDVADGHGGFSTAYTIVVERISAFVEPLAGRRLVSAQQIDARSTYTVTLRRRTDVTARHQVVYHAGSGDRVFDVLATQDVDEAHRITQLLCSENQTI